MKIQRSLLAIAALFAAAALVPATFAQSSQKPERPFRDQAGPRGERAEKLADKFADKLNLSAEQRTRIDAIHAAEREQRQAIMADTSLSREARHDKLSALRDSTRQQVDALLSPEQLAQARELRAKMKGRGEKMKERQERRQERSKN